MNVLTQEGKHQVTVILDMDAMPHEISISADYSLWDTLFILLEAVAFVTRALIDSKEKTPEQLSERINKQLISAVRDYQIKTKSNPN